MRQVSAGEGKHSVLHSILVMELRAKQRYHWHQDPGSSRHIANHPFCCWYDALHDCISNACMDDKVRVPASDFQFHNSGGSTVEPTAQSFKGVRSLKLDRKGTTPRAEELCDIK